MPYSELRHGRISWSGQIYLITTVTHARAPIFSELDLGRIVVRALHDETVACRARTFAFVVMPDHVHWLMQLAADGNLSSVVKQFKGMTAREVNRYRGAEGAVWQAAFHDRAIRKEEDLPDVARYVVRNPVRAGLVRSVGAYSLWDAAWL
jgi:putative transposase